MSAIQERSLSNLSNGRKKRHPVGVAPQYLDNVSAAVTTESASPSEPVVRREEKTAIVRSSVSQGIQGSCTRQDVPKTFHTANQLPRRHS